MGRSIVPSSGKIIVKKRIKVYIPTLVINAIRSDEMPIGGVW